MLDIFSLEATAINPTLISIIYSICLSFILSTSIALTYQKTFQGLSYSRNFIQAMILSSIVTAIAMQAIGDNLARGMGMMGALAIIRFRSSLKDPKDMIYIFVCLSLGIACGVYSYSIAIVGTIGFVVISIILYHVPFAKTSHFDGLLRFNVDSNEGKNQQLETILSNNCDLFALVTLREVAQGSRLDYAYQVKIKNNSTYQKFMHELQKIESIRGLNLMLQESTVEV